VRCNRHVTLEVEDNGIGIEEHERDLVFDRFYRVLGTRTEGSGLGLAIVREVAEAHRGRASVAPNPTESGTIFRVTLPRAGGATD
jgi:two-component system sensor histidine kinase TctE